MALSHSAQIVLQIWPKFQLTDSPGGTPLYKPYKYVPPQRVFAPFWSGNGYCVRGNHGTGVYEHIYRFSSKWMRKKEIYPFLLVFWSK